jgi:hypothetical protein
MRVPNSFLAFPRLTAVALLAFLLDSSEAAPAGQPFRGTPIDSPPETNAPAIPAGPQTNPTSAMLSPSNLLAAPKTASTQTIPGYLEIGFDKLAGFKAGVVYEEGVTNGVKFPHAKEMTGEIPQQIKTLDNQKVAVKGFMLPLRQENGLATEFILLRNRMMCCYGMMPQINEWIHVRMSGKGVRCIMDIPVTVCGKLHVEEYRENRTMLGIYRLDGEKLELPGDS